VNARKKKRVGTALLLRDVQTIQELALGVQEGFPYNTESHAKAEQIYELANQLETLIEEAKDEPTRRIR
jgi:hypothetical protein